MTGQRLICVVCVSSIALVVAAQDSAPESTELILAGDTFQVAGHTAFVFLPAAEKRATPQPWVMYAPTLLPRYPDAHENVI